MPTLTMSDFAAWIGRIETTRDPLGPGPAQAAAATLEGVERTFQPGDELPALWHWFYFLPTVPQNQLGADGHPERSETSFLPPLPLLRRMFAGARFRWLEPLRLGRETVRESEIVDVIRKRGKSGELGFVTVEHRFQQSGQLCVVEQQDLVYREQGSPIAKASPVELPDPPRDSHWQTVESDARLLFRFSALTFNAHRIHYDRDYAACEEGYPGLVVHGQLTAIRLLQLARAHTERRVESFTFRGKSPLFDGEQVRMLATPTGDQFKLFAQGCDGREAMEAVVGLG